MSLLYFADDALAGAFWAFARNADVVSACIAMAFGAYVGWAVYVTRA